MQTRTTAELEQTVERLEKSAAPIDLPGLEQLSKAVAKSFGVQPDEVAILELSSAGNSLKFLLPEKLRKVGSVPLSSTTALAARTARERRADVINNFASARHASVFEGVPLGRSESGVIQKIMSAPILGGDKVVGVVQISRKGGSPNEAGPDFSVAELRELQGMNQLWVRVLTLCRSAVK